MRCMLTLASHPRSAQTSGQWIVLRLPHHNSCGVVVALSALPRSALQPQIGGHPHPHFHGSYPTPFEPISRRILEYLSPLLVLQVWQRLLSSHDFGLQLKTSQPILLQNSAKPLADCVSIMASTPASKLPVALFGYDSSLFTQKARLALRLKQIPYTYIVVPSMMPRPLLRNYFNITYRKIPILAIGREIYLDTSLICEALDSCFPAANGYGDLHPKTKDGGSVRALSRVFASYYSDRPLFRAVCGLMPPDVWRSGFGTDRAGLIGHKLNADKLEKKVPECLSLVDLHLSLLEEMVAGRKGADEWVLGTTTPSLTDLALYAQLDWGRDISEGKGVADLSAGEVEEGTGVGEGMKEVFNAERFPKTSLWYLNARNGLGNCH